MPDNSNSKSGAESFGIGIIGALVSAVVVALILGGDDPDELATAAKKNTSDLLRQSVGGNGGGGGGSGTEALRQQADALTSAQSFSELQQTERDIYTRAENRAGAGPKPTGVSFGFGSEVKTQNRQRTNNPSPTRSTDDDLQPLSSISDEPVTTTAAGDPLSDRDFARAARNA